jgi:hypothetical protein
MASRIHWGVNKVFGLVLAIAFGVIALTVTYSAFKSGFEIRSKAKVEGVIVKSWEFNGTSLQGWQATGASVSDGFFRIPAGGRTFEMANKNPQVRADAGAKISLQFTVTPDKRRTPIPPWAKASPSPTEKSESPIVQRGGGSADERKAPPPPEVGYPYTFFVEVSYDVAGKTSLTKAASEPFTLKSNDPQTFTATLALPLLNRSDLSSLAISFPRLTSRSQVSVDWIRITVPESVERSATRAGERQGQISPRPTRQPSPTKKPQDSPWCRIMARIPGGTSLPDYARNCLGNQNRINWETNSATLSADNFYITANGKTFYGKSDPNTPPMSILSDPGNPTYTSLEVMWVEQGVQMRLFIYFTSDGKQWWSEEFRTYNGQPQGDWIYYYGDFFRSALGTPYSARTLDLTSTKLGPGTIHFDNLRISTRFAPTPTQYPTPQATQN